MKGNRVDLMVYSSREEKPVLVNPSPFCTKLELFFQVAGVKYLKPTPEASPTGKLPYIKVGGKFLADSAVIIDYFERERGVSLDDGLSDDVKARSRFAVSACEDKLYFAMQYIAWLHDANWPTTRNDFFFEVPWGFRNRVANRARRQVHDALRGQGMGRRTLQDVIALGTQVIDDLEVALGDSLYFFGSEKPTIADVAIYAQLNHILYVDIPFNPLGDHLKTKATLVAFVDTITARYFPAIHENRAAAAMRKKQTLLK